MKKTTCVLLALAAIAALFGCAGKPADNSAAQSSGESPQPASEPISEPVSQPDESVSQPDEPVSQPDESVSQPEESVSQPEESVSQPEESVSQPEEPEKVYTDGKKLVVFGDSITALGSWGRTAADELNMYFFNGAKGGITSAQGIDRFPAYVAGRGADFVTLLFGMNDLIMVSAGKPRVTPEQFETNMKKLVQMVRDCGATPILLTANPLDPNRFWSAQGQGKEMYESVGGDPLAWLEVYNDVTRKVAAEEGVLLADMFAACEGVPYSELLYDGIHLSQKGNRIFADTLIAAFKEHYAQDPEAERVNNESDFIDAASVPDRISIISDEPAGWFTADAKLLKIEKTDDGLKLFNTNGQWPEAECLPVSPVSVPVENGYLYYDLSTVGVNASILLFFGGSTPSAYTEGTYVSINAKLGAKVNEVGDITPGQDLKGKIKLSELGIPAKNFKDGRVLITGVKVFVAGAANKPVILRELSVGTE